MEIKAVQLDLARQKETVQYVCEFADLLKNWGMNALVLYLEGRVKTKSFPYKDSEAAYLPEEITAMVQHCKELDMEVIPVCSSLGHTNMFLSCPELEHLAETVGCSEGRFMESGKLGMMCPSKEEVYSFFDAGALDEHCRGH